MPNIGAVLKQEIQRLAVRVSKSQGESTRRTVIAQRKQMATLRAQVAALQKQVASLQKSLKTATTATAAPEQPAKLARPMRASAIRALRTRLGISAMELAKLVGVTDQSVYNWEHGKAKPKAAQAVALAELRGLGKRAVRHRMADLS